ncbi:RAD55 family ATPase [Candidatus Hecatella orcuttiae]|jgi:KaiC/GvpD/RAD55 family RecA-like ATPase|uniref:RAD55 family ATPase n=1 Tax=Candidatus Hecatella orcuttiae TaxID=1935119 RepID=UPI002868305E|nr:ATPase domain-containing protein [Candidatus Hecatella orcuttiae]
MTSHPKDIIPTGIEGLDEILGGGLPQGRNILVIGGPGTGKTILSAQYLCNGISMFNEKGLYITLEEDVSSLKRELSKLDLNFEKHEKDGMLKIVDYSIINYMPQREIEAAVKFLSMPAFKISSLLEVIRNSCRDVGAKRVVLDSLSALTFQEPELVKRRLATMLIFKTFTELGVTALIISEVKANLLEREFIFEEYLSDGVIVMQNIRREDVTAKSIHVEKMRGVSHDIQPHPYKIDQRGITVFPKEKLFITP